MDLRGGSVEWASKDKSSKKHVIEVGRSAFSFNTKLPTKVSHFETFARCNERAGAADLLALGLSRIQLKTRQGTELLIQSDNDALINEWYRALQDTISTHVSSHSFTHLKMSARVGRSD